MSRPILCILVNARGKGLNVSESPFDVIQRLVVAVGELLKVNDLPVKLRDLRVGSWIGGPVVRRDPAPPPLAYGIQNASGVCEGMILGVIDGHVLTLSQG